MNHNHKHGHSHSHGALAALLDTSDGDLARVIRRVTVVGCVVNALLTAFKIVFGLLGGSDALVADGYHSLYDFTTDIIVLLFIGVAYRPADDSYSYGYGKFQTFVSFVISLVLFVVAAHICIEAVESIDSFIHGESLPKPELSTVIVAVMAIAAKELLFRYNTFVGRKIGSSALLANAWHIRSDALASVATLIGVALSHFLDERWRILDPCVSLLIAVLILIAAIRIFKPLFLELMEKSLPADTTARARETILHVEGVENLARLKSRRNGHYMIFDAVVAIAPHLTIDEGYAIARRTEQALRDAFGKYIMVSVMTVPAK